MVDVTKPDDARLLIALSALPVLVQFTAVWCGPCQAITPIIVKAAADYEGRVTILTIDVDASKDVAAQHKVDDVPALLLFEGGAAVARFEGGATSGDLSHFLQAHIGAAS